MANHDHDRPQIAIVTCIKNEGEDLVEWLCFHRHIGVSRFVIYDNLSTDATQRILAAVPFRDEITVRRIARSSPQKAAFADALRRFRNTLDWTAFIDADEFVVPLGDLSLSQKLAELTAAGVDGLGIHWRIFGSAGNDTRPAGLVTECFTRRSEDSFHPNQHVKSFVRLSRVRSMVTQHYFKTVGPYRMDDGCAPPQDFNGLATKASFNQGFAIHHYITKSHAQCLAKIARGRPKPDWSAKKYRSPDYWDIYNRNEVEDLRAARVIAPIREQVMALREKIGRD